MGLQPLILDDECYRAGMATTAQVFHAVEKERREICQARREPFLRGLLLGVERSWELFAREQGGIFADKMEKVSVKYRSDESWRDSSYILFLCRNGPMLNSI